MKVFAPLGFAMLLTGAASGQEAPPPPVETELAPGSRLSEWLAVRITTESVRDFVV
jgi:hypothetical protein